MRWMWLVGAVSGLVCLSACRESDAVPTRDASADAEIPGDASVDAEIPGDASVDAEIPGDAGSCTGLSLTEYCKHRPCPSSPDAVIEMICGESNFRGYHVQTNECGGTTVRHVIALSQVQYHFGEQQRLVGVTQVTDTPAYCGDVFKSYGERCTDTAPPPQTGCSDDDAGADDDAS